MKKIFITILSALLCFAFISCTSNISNGTSVSVTIPENARAGTSRTSLVYTFTLATADGEVIGTQEGTASKTVKFAGMEPGDYVMTVDGAPKDVPGDIQWEGSESFTLKTGENKKLIIKMHTMDLFKLNDGGIKLDYVVKQETLQFKDSSSPDHYGTVINLTGFQNELLKKLTTTGNWKDVFLQDRDTLLLSLKGTSTQDLSMLFYNFGISGENWNTFNAPIKANETFEIYLPVNCIQKSLYNGIFSDGSLILNLNLYVNKTDECPTFKNVEVGLKIYRANQKANTSTFILNKACVDKNYRYEGIVKFGTGDVSINSTHKVNIAGTTKKEAAVDLALVNYGNYQDLTTTEENTKPVVTFKPNEKLNENVSMTIKNERKDNTLGLQLISYCDNTSYKDVLAIYNFKAEEQN